MQHPLEKIITQGQLNESIKNWKQLQHKIVFTNGCFDILHKGHIDYLYKARQLGSFLIVGLNSDSSVRLLNKRNSRPLQDEQSRAQILASLYFVDAIVIFDEQTPLNLITKIQPDILVKGGDYSIENIVGYDIVKANGGVITTIPFLEGHSTTAIENKIIKSIS